MSEANLTEDCACCEAPAVETRLQVEAANAICCGLPAPISGYGEARFSAFAYNTTYTVRTYGSNDPEDYTETTCIRSRSRTGEDYAFSNDGETAPSCEESDFTDSGCEDVYGSLPSCNIVSPNLGVQCISNTEHSETSSTAVDCGDEAISAIARANAGILYPFEDSPWLPAYDGMLGGGSGYGGTIYSRTSYQIRKVGYPVPTWIVLTIERTDMDSNVDYIEDTILLPWGVVSGVYELEPSYGEFLQIIDVKVFTAPQSPPP